MKQHIVVKLYRQLAGSERIPHWVDFITDKSIVRESIEAGIDRLMHDAGLAFWVVREYPMRERLPTAAELAEGLERTYRLILQRDYELPSDLVERIRLLPSVEEARPIEVSQAPLPAPQLARSASLPSRRAGDLIHLPYAQLLTKGAGTRVAVLDTGVHAAHAELQGKITRRADFVHLEGLDTTPFVGDFTGYDDAPDDEVGHGTHVSGIVAARGIEMDAGVAPECSLMAVRVLATMKDGEQLVGAGIIDNINTGIKWAVDNGADVINMSLGIRHTGGGLPHQDVIRYALARNVAVVAASGNDGTPRRYYPGALRGVFAIGAANELGEFASFTSYGAPITCLAPGSRVYSAFSEGGYAFASGTSQAAPFVSGAIALMKSYARERGRKLANDAITHILMHTCDRVDRNFRSVRAGYGLINLADAFRFLRHQLG